jgi:predicted ATPase/DNA-binding SARP family transcriptional activator
MNFLPWRLTLLGSLRADANGGKAPITRFRSQKTASLLAFLASHTDHHHPREELVDRFWPDDDTEAGRNSLRVALAALRRELEPAPLPGGSVLAADRFTVGFVSGAIHCDVVEFDAALRRANRAGRDNTEARTVALEEAVSLYTGPLLPGFYDDWICEERERLQAAFWETLERIADSYEARKDFRRALEYARRLAIEQGSDPADPISQRIERLRRLAAETELQEEKGAVETASRPFLPRPLDCLIGRAVALDTLSDIILRGTRLTTLTGPGGTGKTRLALETAAALQSKFGVDNVCFVPLVEITETHRIREAIRDALRLPRNTTAALSAQDAQDAQDALQAQILQRINEAKRPDGTPANFLLVLDNFEQLAERQGVAAADVLSKLLRGSERLLCLVTSRRRVGVMGERLFAVPPLDLPDAKTNDTSPEALAQVSSIALFLERAQSVNPDFQLTTNNAAAVSELCVRLEGLPLAIELAAAWSGSLTPKAMLSRLEERFALLASVRGQDKTHRHRSLWATIAWSYDLLPTDLQQFWARLSVFRGGWTGDSAAALAPSATGVHELLARLRERSLIVGMGEDPSGEIRFTLLESLREWAAQQLSPDESSATNGSHAAYFLHQMESAREKLRGPEEKSWLDRFESDHENFRAAIDHYYSLARQDEAAAQTGLHFVSALSGFWRKRGYLREARQRMDTFLALPLSQAATLERGKVLNSIGLTAWMQNDLEAATAYYEEGLALFHSIEDTIGIGKVLSNLSLIAMERNDYPEVIRLAEESLAVHRSTGDRLSEAMSLGNLGNVYLETDDYAEGSRYHNEALKIYRELGDNEGITIALSGLAYAAVHSGDRNEARRLFHEALVIRQALNDLWRICFSFTSIADFLLNEGNTVTAAQLYGATEALRQEIGAPFSDVRQAEFDNKCTEMRTILGKATFDDAYTTGRKLRRAEAVELALKSCATEA